MNPPTLTLYYDGLCPLCSREMAHYRRRAAGDPSVVFLDITDPAFVPADHGLDRKRVQRLMHVKEGETLYTGIDAFLAIWRRVPGHGFLTWLASIPGVYWMMKGGYHAFAAVRPYLPRRKADCDTGACQR
jgi:predicted DCC family thiol-disulfide oxidoreductase YuxK